MPGEVRSLGGSGQPDPAPEARLTPLGRRDAPAAANFSVDGLEQPAARQIRALIREVALQMLLRCQEDSDGWKHETCRHLGQRILTDGIEIHRRLITHLDLE